MAIDPSTLQLRITGAEVWLDPTKTYLRLSYEVFHVGTGAIVASARLQQEANGIAQIQAADTALVNQALQQFETIKWQFGGNADLGGYSPYDVSLMLERWQFERQATNWKLVHPVCGTFENVAIAGEPFPTIVARAAAILTKVSPPSVWGWASSPGAGQLHAHCVTVAQATSYNVYNDHQDATFTLLGSFPTAAGGTLSNIPAGYYAVRMAGVKAGVVGILGHPVSVLVG